MEQIHRVFLSSTSRDLAEYRAAVIAAVHRLDGWDSIDMESFGARAKLPDEFCRQRVRECDVFVGVLGHCYGGVHESGQSFTEREYEEAGAQEKPRLMFIAPTSLQVEAKWMIEDGNLGKQKAFRERVNEADTRDKFHNPDDLAGRVATALQNLDFGENGTGEWSRNPDLVHPYPLQPNFTGRIAERKWLTEWFTADSHPVCVVEAIGGMGKSALAWVWLHADVLGKPPAGCPETGRENLRVPEDQRPEGVLFWSFYEGDSDFGAFLDRAARYVGASDVSAASLSDREKLDTVLRALEQRRILLILDGFERELRDYFGYRAPYQGDEAGGEDGNDCVDPRAAEFLQSAASLALTGRVLLTSRLFPNELTDLAGCHHKRLKDLALDDVVSFFEATGVKGTRAEMAQAVAPYGGHPLSVRLLARAIMYDRRMRGDINAAGRHTVLDKLRGKESHHILEVAYGSVQTDRRNLLSRIAAFRSPIDYEALLVFNPFKTEAKFEAALEDLEARGLLLRNPDSERYDLHPIVREYAYARLENKAGAHRQLCEYFQARPGPEQVETLADLAATIELYWHTVSAGRLDAACGLLRDRLIPDPLYFRFGAYQQMIKLLGALFPGGEDQPPRLASESAQGWALHSLGGTYNVSGQPRRAVPVLEAALSLAQKLGEKKNIPIGLVSLADCWLRLCELEAAEGALRRGIELSREVKDEFQEAVGHQELGRLLACEGRFAQSERELETALGSLHAQGQRQGECVVWAYRGLVRILRGDPKAALVAAWQSRRLGDATNSERDIIQNFRFGTPTRTWYSLSSPEGNDFAS